MLSQRLVVDAEVVQAHGKVGFVDGRTVYGKSAVNIHRLLKMTECCAMLRIHGLERTEIVQ